MAFSTSEFSIKIRDLRDSRGSSVELVSELTGIDRQRIIDLEGGAVIPTGDEVLILSDHYRCAFAYLVDDEAKDNTSSLKPLFRAAGERLSVDDRYAVADFLYLCACQGFLEDILNQRAARGGFTYRPNGGSWVHQGESCAHALRDWLKIPHNQAPRDPFALFRSIGIHIFRRALPGSVVSGLFVRHPEAGDCVLVNGAEDLYRQKFSSVHECGHAIMDGAEFNISEPGDDRRRDMVEIRASTFASEILTPKALLHQLGAAETWKDPQKIVATADRLWVSVPALLAGLKRAKLIDEPTRDHLRGIGLRLPEKREPELRADMAPGEQERLRMLLSRGLNSAYVNQCLTAYAHGQITRARAAEMLLVSSNELPEIADLFGTTLRHG